MGSSMKEREHLIVHERTSGEAVRYERHLFSCCYTSAVEWKQSGGDGIFFVSKFYLYMK